MTATVTTVLMWIFTILLLLGILVIVLPVVTAMGGKSLNVGPWAIGTQTSITMGKTSILAGAAMIVVGFLGSMITGIATTKGKQTFKRMYM